MSLFLISYRRTAIFQLRREFAPTVSKIWFESLSVNVFPVSNFHNADNEYVIMNLVKNSISATTESILFLAGEFQRLRWSRIVCQTVYDFDDSLDILLRQGIKILCNGFLDLQLISCHDASVP